jgi:hypothetical protein
MPWVRFEPTTPASERVKTVLALDLSATVTGYNAHREHKMLLKYVMIGNMRTEVGRMEIYEFARCDKKGHNDVIATKEFRYMCWEMWGSGESLLAESSDVL